MTDKMSHSSDNPLLGIGIYTISEAGQLSGVHPNTIRRWLKGYQFKKHNGSTKTQQALWEPDISPLNDFEAISFMDLIELRFVDAFRKHGIQWKIIRSASEYAAERYKMKHPFANRKFKTDGKWIFEETLNKLMNTYSRQFTFREIISPSLFAGIEFSDDDIAMRWFPMHDSKVIVIDPHRNFGKPILCREGIPTRALADAYKAEKNYKRVAELYDITPASVKVAVQFEHRLAA